MKRRLLLTFISVLSFTLSFAQSNKISPSTRFLLAGREGKISVETPQNLQGKLIQMPSAFNPNGIVDNTTFDNIHPFATPFTVNDVEMAQCWINMTDQNYSVIESLGVKILAKFNDRVTANVPLDVIEKIAALKNVTKISVAKKLKSNTYRSRVLTNVDDVITNSADAKAAGLLQAYNGSDVVLGVIDTGIDFGHSMFSGRIKKKYIYNTDAEELQEYTGSSVYFTDETHGTHTSSIAGGSSVSYTAYVYTTGTSYSTVSNASFGGMAPGADLILCDLGDELTDANIAACIKNISDYAASVGKPYVISLSLGGHFGPHDGTGDMADICAQYTGPGKVIVFAAGNEGEDGIYLGKNASQSSPAMTVLTSQTRSSYSVDFGAMITYARTPDTELAARYYVVNTSSNTVLWTSNEITTEDYFVDDDGNIELYGAEISVNDTGADGTTKLSNYFTAYNNDSDSYGYLCCYMDKDQHNNKWNVETILYYLKAVSSNYKIGVSIYPKDAGTTMYIDSWPVAYIDFTASSASVNGNTFSAGGNDCSISDEGTFPSVISVGAYTSSVYWRGGTTMGQSLSWTSSHTYLDVASFSSYQREGSGPLGTKLPWITAPGEVILAAYNSGYTVESNYYYAYGTNKALGAMSGTSMATPCVAGITALWLGVDPTLTPAEIKNIMQQTAIKDTYVTGTNAYKFGQGKIDALAGIEYILDNTTLISATPQTINISAKPDEAKTETVNVKGTNLVGNITATLNDPSGLFSIDKTSITKTNAESTNGEDITVNFSGTPTEGTYTATITLSSQDASDVTVTITATVVDGGTASDAYLDIAKYATIYEAGWRTALVNNLYKYTEYSTQKVAWLTLPVYGGFVGARYATNSSTFNTGHPQAWIDTNITSTNNTYAGTTWTNTASATSPFNGSSAYFTSASARAIGYSSRNTTTTHSVSFYVTNTNEVQLRGTGTNRTSSTYPASLNIYECTENANGTLNVGTTAVVNQTSSSQSTFTLTGSGLDVDKIYKVEANVIRGYLYEIAFRTPLKSDPEINANPASLTFSANINKTESKSFTVTGSNLTGNITAEVTSGSNVFSIDQTTISQTGGNANGTINVTFAPTAVGTYTGTVTLTSQGAQSVTVNLSATATEPELIVDPEELTITTPAATSKTGIVSLLGENLNGDVTFSLADANGVFSLSNLSLSKASVENGADLTVTFSPATDGEYTATITVSTEGIEDQTVILTGIATKGWFDVTVGKYGLASLYTDIPLVIPFDEYEDLLGVFYGSSYDAEEKELRMKPLYTYIPANTGVVVQGNSGTYRFPIATVAVDPLSQNVFSGVLETTPVDQLGNGTVLTLGMGSNGYVGFYKYSGSSIRANSIYILMPDNGVKATGALSIVTEDEATGIRYIYGTVEELNNDGWYTIQGLKLNGQPTDKGIYIHNGKTVLIK